GTYGRLRTVTKVPGADQLFASACYVAGGLGGAALAGTVGSAWGVATATLAASAVWWLQLRSALREHHQDSIPEVRTP
ncbi:hypothetical protein ACWEPT_43150, partial [Streptomyces chartreusis]